MFTYEGRYFVIARRQAGFAGNYDLGLRSLPQLLRTRLFQAAYWITPKRTALWEIHPETLTIEWLADFPSRGDTAFAGIIETTPESGSFTTTRHRSMSVTASGSTASCRQRAFTSRR